MNLNETHHAHVVLTFYKEFQKAAGDHAVFVLEAATRAYATRRGQRMVRRALRDGNPPDIVSYFAYGELILNDDSFEGGYQAGDGCVNEHMTKCPWSDEYKKEDMTECGIHYCENLDISIVRGFNPNIDFVTPQKMHINPACDFFFKGAEVKADFLETYNTRLKEGQFERKDMTYHTADVYQMFDFMTSEIFPEKYNDMLLNIRQHLKETYGQSFLDTIDSFDVTDFMKI